MNIPSVDEYDVLVVALPNTRGEEVERELLCHLHMLAIKHGLGHLHQMVTGMEDLWRRPERRAAYETVKRQWVKDMSGFVAKGALP